jgi:hypothetical protein
MLRNLTQITHDIDTFSPHDGSWRRLDDLLAELFQQPVTEDGVRAMLRVLERFPADDGGGVLWSVVHGLESLSGYEPHLIASIRRKPSQLAVVMIHRLLKAGLREVGGVPIRSVLEGIMGMADVHPLVKASAQKVLKTHDAW